MDIGNNKVENVVLKATLKNSLKLRTECQERHLSVRLL